MQISPCLIGVTLLFSSIYMSYMKKDDTIFKKFMNTFYRDKNKVVSNVQNIVREFEAFYTRELQIEIVTKKTIVAQTKYTKILAEGLIFLKLNSRSLYFTIASYMNIIEAKLFVIRKLEMVKTLGTFLRTDNGYQVTAPEGFSASSLEID